MSGQFEEYITYRALGRKYDDTGKILDHLLSDVPEGSSPDIKGYGEIKNLCAKVPSALIDRLDSVIGYLDISKREFVELAVIEAIQRSEKIIRDSLGSAETENVKN